MLRKGRADQLALRNSFTTFFPGAQWVGDGTKLSFRVNDESFTFNLELNVDAYSDACVGAHIGDEEDAGAVVAAYDDGVDSGDRTTAFVASRQQGFQPHRVRHTS